MFHTNLYAIAFVIFSDKKNVYDVQNYSLQLVCHSSFPSEQNFLDIEIIFFRYRRKKAGTTRKEDAE